MPGLESPLHLLLVLFIILIVFGPGRLPEIGSSLGRAIRSFREAMSERDAIQIDAKRGVDPTVEKKDPKP